LFPLFRFEKGGFSGWKTGTHFPMNSVKKSELRQDFFTPHPAAYKLLSLIKHKQNLLKPKTERGGEVDAMIGFGRVFVS